jgi:hypothetical protein
MDYCLGMFGGVENSNIFFFHLRLALDQYKGNVYNLPITKIQQKHINQQSDWKQ